MPSITAVSNRKEDRLLAGMERTCPSRERTVIRAMFESVSDAWIEDARPEAGSVCTGCPGGEIRPGFEPKPGEIVATEHWCSSGFANTDLDLQLKKHGIHQLIVIGLIAHPWIEATVRFAAELGYEVTVVKDATADYSDEEMHAALDINIPNYASAIISTEGSVASISPLEES